MVRTGRVNNVIRIPTSLQGKFFRIWIEFLTPLHNLTNREKDVVAAFIKARFELSKSVIDNALLDKIVMSDDVKSQIKADCNVSDAFFQVILGKLRKTGVIVDGKINPKFIPKNIKADDQTFQLLLYFDLNATNN
jgi:regulator of RNase E activity RraB